MDFKSKLGILQVLYAKPKQKDKKGEFSLDTVLVLLDCSGKAKPYTKAMLQLPVQEHKENSTTRSRNNGTWYNCNGVWASLPPITCCVQTSGARCEQP